MADETYTYRGDGRGNTVDEDTEGRTSASVEGVGGDDNIALRDFDNVTVYGGEGAANPNDGDDSIAVSGSQTALIYGNGGNDSVDVAVEDSTDVYGGMGDDTLTVESDTDADVLIYGGFGSDDITVSTEGDVTAYGGNASADPTREERADNISIHADNALVYGNAGDDHITASVETSAEVYGGLDDDAITVQAVDGEGDADVIVYGGLGIDDIDVNTEGDVTVYGGNGSTDPRDGADVIDVGGDGEGEVSAENVLIFGNGDDDHIKAFASGTVEVFGADGDDAIDVTHANDDGSEAEGDASDETINLIGGLGSDHITLETDVNATVSGGTSTDAMATNESGSTGDAIEVTYTGDTDATFQLSGSADTDQINFSSSEEGVEVELIIDAGGGADDDIEVNGQQIRFDGEDYFVGEENVGADNSFAVQDNVTVTILNLDPTD